MILTVLRSKKLRKCHYLFLERERVTVYRNHQSSKELGLLTRGHKIFNLGYGNPSILFRTPDLVRFCFWQSTLCLPSNRLTLYWRCLVLMYAQLLTQELVNYRVKNCHQYTNMQLYCVCTRIISCVSQRLFWILYPHIIEIRNKLLAPFITITYSQVTVPSAKMSQF